MKFKGIKKACSESKNCRKDGYGLQCHIWLRDDEVFAECFTAGSWIQWRDQPDAEIYTRRPMSMKEIEEELIADRDERRANFVRNAKLDLAYRANSYETFEEFKNEIGWEVWMEKYLSIQDIPVADGKELDARQIETIDRLLKKAWDKRESMIQ